MYSRAVIREDGASVRKGGFMSSTAMRLRPDEVDKLLAANAEARRLLEKHQWSGLTPMESHGVCPECCGSSWSGHRPGCAIATALEELEE